MLLGSFLVFLSFHLLLRLVDLFVSSFTYEEPYITLMIDFLYFLPFTLTDFHEFQ